jgi:hypothetical protein
LDHCEQYEGTLAGLRCEDTEKGRLRKVVKEEEEEE